MSFPHASLAFSAPRTEFPSGNEHLGHPPFIITDILRPTSITRVTESLDAPLRQADTPASDIIYTSIP